MLGVRWHKVINDLLINKTRTVLIVLSIAVGLFAIGTTVNARIILSQDLAEGYAAITPSSGVIRTIQTFDDDLVRSVRQMSGVQEADARTHLTMRFQVRQTGQGNTSRWRDLQLFAVPDYEQMRVNKIRPQAGAWPPPKREILIERSGMELIGAEVGDTVLIELSKHKVRELRIAGTVHDLAQLPSPIDGAVYGYASFDTLEWLGEPRGLNELHIVARNTHSASKAEALRVIGQLKDKLEKGGYTIPMSTTAEPGQLPLNDLLQAVLMLLGALGFLSLFLSVFLIVNTVSALVTQQIRQIGIMKAVGARGSQMVFMYLALALVYGVLALALAVPLGVAGARALSGFMAGFFNFDLTRFYVPPQAVALQVVIGLVVPVLAALYPVLSVLRVTAADAIGSYGLRQDEYGAGWMDRLLTIRSELTLRLLSRPLMLSLRNTFRRKGRLALTLITLTLAGAIFVGVFSLRASLSQTLADMMGIYRFDLLVTLGRAQRVEQLESRALEVDGVARAKSWLSLPVRRVRADGSESENIILFAPPVQDDLVLPAMTQGRWLRPDDARALVVSTAMLKNEPDLKLGDDILLKVDGRQVTFRIVGVTLGLPFVSQVFAGYADVARVTQELGESSSLLVVTERHDAASQAQAATALEAHFKASGSRVNSVAMMREEMQEVEMSFAAVVALALVMALLLAIVGGLGLMGTLSINVLERTREIGVMRAIGAPDGAVARVFVVEGILIGLISWLAGSLCAVPLSNLLSDVLGVALLQSPLAHSFSMLGVWLWLVVVVILSALASFLPARNASRLTVRDVLAYE